MSERHSTPVPKTNVASNGGGGDDSNQVKIAPLIPVLKSSAVFIDTCYSMEQTGFVHKLRGVSEETGEVIEQWVTHNQIVGHYAGAFRSYLLERPLKKESS